MKTAQAKPKLKAKDKLLDAAYDLMISKGYVGTSIDEICAKAELTKGSFFYYFETKEDLAKALVSRTCSSRQDEVESLEKDPLARIYQHLDCAIESSRSADAAKGCLLGTFAQELSDTHPEIRAICKTSFDQIAERMTKDFKEAKAKYAPGSDIDPKSLAQHYIAVLEGALILSKVHLSRSVLADNLEHFKAYVRSLFKK